MRLVGSRVLIALLAGLVTGCGMSGLSAPFAGKDILMAAPELAGEDLEQKPVRLSSYRGRVVLVDFWQTSCPPCDQFHATERELHEKFAGREFSILGVLLESEPDIGLRVQKRQKSSWPSLLDARAEMSRDWGVYGTPTIFLVDAAGMIRYRSEGPASFAVLEERISRLLDAKAEGPRKEK